MTATPITEREASEERPGPILAGPGRFPDFAAEAVVQAPPSKVFTILADLKNHWLLTGSRVEALTLIGPEGAHTGAKVRLRGPLGLQRTAITEVLDSLEPEWMIGAAKIGPTEATVRWSLQECESCSRVRLEAWIDRIGLGDRVLLALGGRAWLQTLFSEATARLAELQTGLRNAPVRVAERAPEESVRADSR